MSTRSVVVVGGLLAGLLAGIAQAANLPGPDADADGVADSIDDCPQSPVGARVDAKGCALDEDLDGVADGVDRCPGSPAGAAVNAMGCASRQKPGPVSRGATAAAPKPPPPATAVRAAAPAPRAPVASDPASAAGQIPVLSEPDRTFYFDEGESELTWAGRRAVKQSAVDFLPELDQHPSTTLVLSGHADTKSDGASAARIATARARAVRDFLIANGVPAQRISMRVPGANEPRYFGASLGRNCRVELRVVDGRGRGPAEPLRIPVERIGGPPRPATPIAGPAAVPVAAAPPTTPTPSPPPSPKPAAPPPPPAVPVMRSSPPPTATESASRSLSKASVNFAPYGAVLDADAVKTIEAFVQDGTRKMLADADARVTVVSGIDASETDPSARQLAESRAATVRARLASLGLPRHRIEMSTRTQTGARRVDLEVVTR